MGTGAITQYVDVAQLVLYAFWAFFAGLIYYLVRENHREGYPLETDGGSRAVITGWPIPEPKTYLLEDGSTVLAPRPDPVETPALAPRDRNAGGPYLPTGNPLLDGVGPGSYCNRDDHIERLPDGSAKVVPLRAAPEFDVAKVQSSDPRGYPVYGADGVRGGTVVDVWFDKIELGAFYLEVETTGGRRVLLPINFSRILRPLSGGRREGQVRVEAITGGQFEQVPGTRHPTEVTRLEEERICSYYGGGLLYATPERQEPLV